MQHEIKIPSPCYTFPPKLSPQVKTLKSRETSTALADITPQGYSLIHEPRQGKQCGDVAILTNKKFDVSPCIIPQ